MPQDMSSNQLLEQYQQMRGPGCDITLLLLPLPCGAMEPAERLRALAATTRRLKLSPEAYLLRFFATYLVRLVGLQVRRELPHTSRVHHTHTLSPLL